MTYKEYGNPGDYFYSRAKVLRISTPPKVGNTDTGGNPEETAAAATKTTVFSYKWSIKKYSLLSHSSALSPAPFKILTPLGFFPGI